MAQNYKVDIATASEDDIAEALKEHGRVAISGGIPFETNSAALAPSAADWSPSSRT
jgi:hypothetical protein